MLKILILILILKTFFFVKSQFCIVARVIEIKLVECMVTVRQFGHFNKDFSLEKPVH